MNSDFTIPYCPVMSAGNDHSVICAQERCAWYMKGSKTCAVYILAHKAAMDIKKQMTEG